jgi:hypothetical protein
MTSNGRFSHLEQLVNGRAQGGEGGVVDGSTTRSAGEVDLGSGGDQREAGNRIGEAQRKPGKLAVKAGRAAQGGDPTLARPGETKWAGEGAVG